jgi:excisionase family DNA binding protein
MRYQAPDRAPGRTYLTSGQVGELLQVSSRTVERWAQEDATMPVTRLGRLLRFERTALEAWLARHSTRQSTRAGRAQANAVITQDRATDVQSVVGLSRA